MRGFLHFGAVIPDKNLPAETNAVALCKSAYCDKSLFNHTKEFSMKKKPKQIAAIICIVLLVLLYVATLVISLLDFPGSDRLFAACLVATVGLPILLWIYIWAYGKFTNKATMADLYPESNDSGARDNPPS